MDAPLWGDTGGHTGTAPTKLHHIFPHIPHKQNNHLRAIHSNDTNRPTRNSSQTKSTVPHVICPNETVGANIRAQFSQAKCVGAVPVCPPERSRSGVSIPKIGLCITYCARGLNDGAHGRAHRHRPYQPPPNRTVCHYPIGVILSIAQGWQVQRSLPWVTMQARRLPPWGLYFFHHIAFLCPPTQHSGAKMHRALPPPFLK